MQSKKTQEEKIKKIGFYMDPVTMTIVFLICIMLMLWLIFTLSPPVSANDISAGYGVEVFGDEHNDLPTALLSFQKNGKLKLSYKDHRQPEYIPFREARLIRKFMPSMKKGRVLARVKKTRCEARTCNSKDTKTCYLYDIVLISPKRRFPLILSCP